MSYYEIKYCNKIVFKNEIKYRGKTLKSDKWIYGTPVFSENIIDIIDNGVISRSIIPETLGKFTGMINIERKEIYEDDILAEDPRYTFKRGNKITQIYDTAVVVKMDIIEGSDDMGVDCIGYPLYFKDMYIIGNIHDNPDLIPTFRHKIVDND